MRRRISVSYTHLDVYKRQTLICHKSERNKINKTFRFTEPEEQFRHENYLPPIITPELWEQTQMMLSARKRLNVRAAPSQEILRYSGLLRCEDCGRAMFGRRIHQMCIRDSRCAGRACRPLGMGGIFWPHARSGNARCPCLCASPARL